jgi:DHA2 family methylenomycin A resistance protein-like MFS transporter
VTLVAAVRLVPHTGGRSTARLDVTGLCGLATGLAGAVFTVIAAGRHASVLEIAVAAAIAVAGLVVGVRAETRAPHPVLPLDLLRRPPFFGPNVVALTMNLTFNGLLFVATLYLQDVRGFAPIAAGCAVLPLALPLVALAPVSGRLTANRGPRTAVLLGCVIAAAGVLFLFGVGAHDGLAWLLIGFGVLGCGAGLVTASVVAAVVRATPADRPGLATGMSNTARQTGTATGVAVFGAVAGPAHHVSAFVPALHLLAGVAAVMWVGAAVLAAGTIETGSVVPTD